MLISATRPAAFVLAAIFTFALSACGINSQIVNSSVDPEFSKLDLHGVLVVAVAKEASNLQK